VLLKIKGATDNERNTPLLIASMRGLCGVMELLLAASADAAAKNKKGKGVLDHTKEIKDEEKRAAVLALMAECSVLCAVATGKADLVAAAVAKGCNIKETDQEGNSGIHIAAAQGSNDIPCILRQVRMCSLTNEFSDRSTGLRTQASHSTVLASPVCVSLCVSVVQCAPASRYIYLSTTRRFPDERTRIEAMPLPATSAELSSGLGMGLGLPLGLGSHSSSPPYSQSLTHYPLPYSQSLTHYPLPPRPLVRSGQTSPHTPRLVVSYSSVKRDLSVSKETYPLPTHASARRILQHMSSLSTPRAHSFVIDPAVINKQQQRRPRDEAVARAYRWGVSTLGCFCVLLL